MTLSEFIKNQNKTSAEFAKELGVSAMAVAYWIKGKRIPDAENMRLIFQVTGGSVTANDFYETPSPQRRAND